MAKYVCAICRERLHLNSADLEEFVPNRFWAILLEKKKHHCGFEGVFKYGKPYSAFVIYRGDSAGNRLARYELKQWKNKTVFFEEEGFETKAYFKKVIKELLEETDQIFQNNRIKDKEKKIRLILHDKLEDYKAMHR